MVCSIYNVLYTMFNVQCTMNCILLYIVPCKVYSAPCMVYAFAVGVSADWGGGEQTACDVCRLLGGQTGSGFSTRRMDTGLHPVRMH